MLILSKYEHRFINSFKSPLFGDIILVKDLFPDATREEEFLVALARIMAGGYSKTIVDSSVALARDCILGKAHRRDNSLEFPYVYGEIRSLGQDEIIRTLSDPSRYHRMVDRARGLDLEVANLLLERVPQETDILRNIVNNHGLEQNSEYFLQSKVISMMEDGDDCYFKQLFEEAQVYHIKRAAILKVQDSAYVKELIQKESEIEMGFMAYGACFLSARGEEIYATDPDFIDTLAVYSVDSFIRCEAISLTKNREILSSYANLSDHECDQYLKSGWNEKSIAFRNSQYRLAARERLEELDCDAL